VFWLEEAFHEDASFYRALREWLQANNLQTLIADGEGDASPHLLRWANEGLVDVIQYDIGGYGFSNWLRLGKQLDTAKVRSAPHHYGGHFGNYAAGHLAGAIENFTFVEWDECATPGLGGSAYAVSEGEVVLPNAPGWGLQLDEAHFRRAVCENGFELTS
jgi:L-alanine-DL-glutamate epimerase-like enolase superfamily enzyme